MTSIFVTPDCILRAIGQCPMTSTTQQYADAVMDALVEEYGVDGGIIPVEAVRFKHLHLLSDERIEEGTA